MIDSFEIYPKIFLMVFADGVEKAYTLYVPAVPTVATVGNHQVIKRTLFRACARKSNTNHYPSVLRFYGRRTRLIPGSPE